MKNRDETHPLGQGQGEYAAVVPQALGDYSNQQLGAYPQQDLKQGQALSEPKPN